MLRLTRREFSSLAIGSLVGCGDSAREPLPVASVVSPAPTPLVSASASAAPVEYVLPLFRVYPRLGSNVPRAPIASLPTPIDSAAKLGERLGLKNLFFKRDDLSGVSYGGGKTRKLEFYLAQARARGAREVITFGGYGSNQAVATALLGKAWGFDVKLFLAPQMPSLYVTKNLLAARRTGATIHVVRDGVGAAQTLAERDKSPNTYLIPPGGSSPLGNLTFVNAALELAEQVRAGLCPVPDCIYMAMGTMGSAIGLAIGLELSGLSSQVIAVRASSPETSSSARFAAMVKETVAYARSLDPSFPDVRLGPERIRFSTNHLGGGYGFPTREGAKAMGLVEQTLGYSLEPTYTAKAFAALVADAQRFESKVVMFWNTHNGRPLLVDGVGPDDFPPELREFVGGQ